ncbi:MAG TPA: hypothetical protein VFS92_02650, partial [Planctomycetota bacterium]|nr:hypothetical protein [Planctomycetota bacterium]
GYAFSVPQRWDRVPVDAGGFLAAKFQSNREYEWTDPKNSIWFHHRPYIEVVVIPFTAKENRGVTVEKTDEGVKVTQAAPWKDVKEYMEKVFQERRIGGFHFSAEDETTIGDMKVRRFEITVDKLVSGERRIYGWEFAAEDCYYGLVAEILLKEEKNLKPDLFRAFQSFKVFPREGKLPGTATPGDDLIIKDPKKEATRERTPEEMKKERDESTARHLNRLKEGMGKDWRVSEGKNFIAVSHSDPRHTQEVLAHAESLRAWLESNLGFVGSGYVGKVIIRIFADRQEYDSFWQAKRVWIDAPEVVTFKDKEGWVWTSYIQSFNTGIYDRWLKDKNDHLRWSLPYWLAWGLSDFVGGAEMKQGRLIFRATVWENVAMKKMRRADDLMPAKKFFTLTSDAMRARPNAYVQIQFFVNFLLAGGAQRNPKYRSILSDYLKNLIFLLDSEDTTQPAAEQKPPQTEEEENELYRQRAQAWLAKEQAHLDHLISRTFQGWTDKDWDSFNAAYRADLK